MSAYPIIRNRSGVLYRSAELTDSDEALMPGMPPLTPLAPAKSSFRRWQWLLVVFVVVLCLYPLSLLFPARQFNARRWPKINKAGQVTACYFVSYALLHVLHVLPASSYLLCSPLLLPISHSPTYCYPHYCSYPLYCSCSCSCSCCCSYSCSCSCSCS
jgi:hypothetical protein